MALRLNRSVLLLLLCAHLYKPISFAFVPPCSRRKSSSPHYNIILYTASQDEVCNDNTSSSSPSSLPSTVTSSTVLPSSDDSFSTLRSIGVDYGLTRTGVAITTGGYHPRPLDILSGYNSTELSTIIVNYVQSEQATNIVLGLPLHKDGSDSEQSTITREFGQCLLQEVRRRCGKGISITLWDERYTSKEAASRIKAEAIARNQRIPSASDLETELDADAACIILEDYYKEFGQDGEIVLLENVEMEKECEIIYLQNLKSQEEMRQRILDERERGRNARQEMIARVKALEEGGSGVVGGGDDDGSKKMKKKKKKKKK